MLRVILFFLLVIVRFGEAQHRVVVKDLHDQMKVFAEEKYISADSTDEQFSTVYFLIDAREYKGHSLEMKFNSPASLFINGRLVQECPEEVVVLKLDSLAGIYTSELSFAVHAEKKKNPVEEARIITFLSEARGDDDLADRHRHHFLDFSILASGILLVCIVLLYRSNPRLFFDYLNFIKLFSIQEREESKLTTKIVASGNLLFYGLASLLLSFLLMVMIFYSADAWGWLNIHSSQNVILLLLKWVSIALLIFTLLIMKSFIVFAFSQLFAFNEAPTLQFFNFVRVIFLTGLFIGLWLAVYFVFGMTSAHLYTRLFYIVSILLSLWVPIVFLKLLRRSPYSVFHLFSYLCATEIFPIVILIRLLFV